MSKIDEKLTKVLQYVENYVENYGYAPTVRDICRDLNVKSTATAHSYLSKLNERGFISKAEDKKRALSLNASKRGVPLLGTVTAGTPIFATENYEDYYVLPKEFNANSDTFMLKIKGDSMVNAGILNGDKIVVRKQETAENGDIAVVLIDDSATVKRFYKKNNKIVLHPENEKYEDIVLDDAIILGVVEGLIRKFWGEIWSRLFVV